MTNQIIYPTCFPCVYCQHRQEDACGMPVVHQAIGVARPFREVHPGFVSDCQLQWPFWLGAGLALAAAALAIAWWLS